MLILGLLLVVVSGAAAAVLIAYNTAGPAETVTAFGRDIANVTLMQAFVAGIAVTLVFLVGLWMIVSAGKRGLQVELAPADLVDLTSAKVAPIATT